ncbi:MAG: type II toxin-antitoxin system HigB family toxin [Sphingomonadaceae bacterium]
MRIISKSALTDFSNVHPEARERLDAWYRACRACDATSLSELRQTFQSADYVPKQFTIFDVGGNEYRIVTAIHYDKQMVFIRSVLTHAQYDKWNQRNRRK